MKGRVKVPVEDPKETKEKKEKKIEDEKEPELVCCPNYVFFVWIKTVLKCYDMILN